MVSKVFAIPLLTLTISLFINNEVGHALLQFWWAPLVICFAFLQFRIIDHSRISTTTSIVYCVISSILIILFVFLFNHTATLFLIGSWISITTVIILFLDNPNSHNNQISSKQIFLTIGILVSISLLLLPVSVNQVLIKLPNLSGKTLFSIHNSQDGYSEPSAYFRHKMADHGEVKLKISANYFPGNDVEPPFLKLRNDQDGVRFIIQDIQYLHTLGLFSKTFLRIGESNLRTLKVTVKDDTVEVGYPEKGGVQIKNLPIESSIWIALPKFSMALIDSSYLILIYVMRLIFWILILTVITQSLPKKTNKKGIVQ